MTNKNKYLFFLPGFGLLMFIIISPLAFNYIIMFFRWKLVDPVLKNPIFAGIDNFIEIFSGYNRFWDAWFKTAIYTCIVVPIEIVLGIILALSLNRSLKFERIIKSVLLLPLAMAPIMVGALWRIMYHPVSGIINYILVMIGTPPREWISSTSTALISVAIVDIWQWTSFVALVILAGLVSLPKEPIEAAKIDGASDLQLFFNITFPLLRNILLIIVILRVIDAIKTFDYLYSLTYGGPGSATTFLTYHIMLVGFREWNMGLAATESVVSALIISLIIMFFFRLMRAGAFR